MPTLRIETQKLRKNGRGGTELPNPLFNNEQENRRSEGIAPPLQNQGKQRANAGGSRFRQLREKTVADTFGRDRQGSSPENESSAKSHDEKVARFL